jgi:hypothetical protein
LKTGKKKKKPLKGNFVKQQENILDMQISLKRKESKGPKYLAEHFHAVSWWL